MSSFAWSVNAATRAKDLAWIEQQAKAFGVAVQERPDFAMIAVQGPNARAKTIGLLHEVDRAPYREAGSFRRCRGARSARRAAIVARTGYTGEDGFEIWFPSSRLSPYGTSCWLPASHPADSARATRCVWRRA